MGASMGGGGDDDGGVIADINVTPLVDVTLVLLIIMMVTAPMLNEPTAIKVDLPKGKTGETAAGPGQGRTLLVGKGGQIQLDGTMITVADLLQKLSAEAHAKPDIEIGVAADKGAEYGSVIQVLDTIRSAGVTKFSLQMEGDVDGAAIGAALNGQAGAGAPGLTPGAAPGAPGAAPGAAPGVNGPAGTAPGAAPVAAPGAAPAADPGAGAAAPAGAPAAAPAGPVGAPAAPAAAPAAPAGAPAVAPAGTAP